LSGGEARAQACNALASSVGASIRGRWARPDCLAASTAIRSNRRDGDPLEPPPLALAGLDDASFAKEGDDAADADLDEALDHGVGAGALGDGDGDREVRARRGEAMERLDGDGRRLADALESAAGDGAAAVEEFDGVARLEAEGALGVAGLFRVKGDRRPVDVWDVESPEHDRSVSGEARPRSSGRGRGSITPRTAQSIHCACQAATVNQTSEELDEQLDAMTEEARADRSEDGGAVDAESDGSRGAGSEARGGAAGEASGGDAAEAVGPDGGAADMAGEEFARQVQQLLDEAGGESLSNPAPPSPSGPGDAGLAGGSVDEGAAVPFADAEPIDEAEAGAAAAATGGASGDAQAGAGLDEGSEEGAGDDEDSLMAQIDSMLADQADDAVDGDFASIDELDDDPEQPEASDASAASAPSAASAAAGAADGARGAGDAGAGGERSGGPVRADGGAKAYGEAEGGPAGGRAGRSRQRRGHRRRIGPGGRGGRRLGPGDDDRPASGGPFGRRRPGRGRGRGVGDGR